MADNVELDAGSGGDTIAADDVGGVKYQVVKLAVGADGAANLVANANPIPISDAGASVTVDGTVSVSGTVTVDASGAAVPVTDNGSSLTVDNGGTFAVQVSSIAAGNNNIGDVDIASIAAGDNNIGNVDVVSLPALPAGSNAIGTVTAVGAAAEDAAASGNPVLVGGRYDSTPRTLETGDAGAIALNASGQVLVEIAAGAGSGGTAAADDADFTAGTTSATPVMGVYESSPSSVTDGDMGVVGITQTRSMKVAVSAALPAGTNNIGDVDVLTVPNDPFGANADAASATGSISAKLRFIASTGIPVTGTVTVGSHAVTNTGTFVVQENGPALTALQLLDDAVKTDDAAFTPATDKVLMIGAQCDATGPDSVDEGDAGALRMTADRGLHVSVRDAAGNNRGLNIDASGQLAVTVASLPASTGTIEVVGDVAHDAAAAGNPVQTGGYATNNIEGVTQVASGDLTRTVHDLNGVQVVRPHTTLEELISERVSNTDGNSTAFTNFAAGGSGVHNYVTQVSIWNSSSTDGFVDFRDGTAGAVKWTFPAPQTGGCTMSFDPPLKFADNTAVAFDVSAAISTVYISVNGFQAQG